MMRNFSKEIKEKIFVAISSSLHLCDIYKETVIAVSKSGSVFLYSLSPDISVYSLDSSKNAPKEDKQNAQPNKPKQNSSQPEIDDSLDQTAIRSKTIIKCIGNIQLLSDTRRVEILYYDLKNILTVKGFIHKNVPSVGLFLVTKDSLIPLHIESLAGTIMLAFNSLNSTIVALPRLLSGSIINYKINEKTTEEIEQYHPEYISQFMVSCFGCKRATHMRINPINQFEVMLWNDEEKPFISFSTLKDMEWTNNIYNFTEKSYIQRAEYDLISPRIGIVISQEKKTLICIWTFEEQSSFKQNNFLLNESIFVTNAMWIHDRDTSSSSFCIWTSSGTMLEVNEHQIQEWKQGSIKSNLFAKSSGSFFVYFSKSGSLTIAGKTSLENDMEKMQCIGEKYKPLSFIKADIHGKTLCASGVHMQRCLNCRKPLLYPLVASEEGISACYCSYECQADHWPLYYASRQLVFFDDKLST